jgi:hypothetical protein
MSSSRVALFLYANISVTTHRGKARCSGGKPYFIDPWRIDAHGQLLPVGYTYTLNAHEQARLK